MSEFNYVIVTLQIVFKCNLMMTRSLHRFIRSSIICFFTDFHTRCPNNYKLSAGPTWSLIKWYSENKGNQDLVKSDFKIVKDKNKDSYIQMVEMYKTKLTKRRQHVEFIYSALRHMKEFGVEKDLEVYKAIIDIFPKGKMIPRNLFQVEFMHYPKDQQCAIDLLEQMEENGVIPDWNMQEQLINVFGTKGYPVRRYWRMMYWMPRFINASPWLLPETVPNDPYQLALLAIKRITSVDVNSKITTFYTSEVEGSLDNTWIVSGQSNDQIDLINNLPKQTPLYVEGRFRTWLRKMSVTYFILKADICTKEEDENYDDVADLNAPMFFKPSGKLKRVKTVHEQQDRMILAVCSTGTSSRDSLLSWIRCLEKRNPMLSSFPVVFTLKAPPLEELVTGGNLDQNLKLEPEPK